MYMEFCLYRIFLNRNGRFSRKDQRKIKFWLTYTHIFPNFVIKRFKMTQNLEKSEICKSNILVKTNFFRGEFKNYFEETA